ncbi:hypothetical protein BCR39DRAFT_588155 [Naematelia encephala]|uniref:Uncharacterized protein n=1 Tax=Naematelia encephala TaxID=71784 RepID=A0A1Y2B4L5_9TREE|nr:hypothetical protein BCR39DRAFT_588155 [Naematelia encephala]
MSAPRMLILIGGGWEAIASLPNSYDKAVALAYEKFSIDKNTHIARLSCTAAEMYPISQYMGTEDVFLTDNDSFFYACANKPVVRLQVHVFDKNPKPPSAAGGGAGAGAAGGSGGGAVPAGGSGGGGAGKKEEASSAKAAEKKDVGGAAGGGGGAGTAASAAKGTTADQQLTCQVIGGKSVTQTNTVTGELPKGPPAGSYLGTLVIEDKTFKQTFSGQQLGPNEVLTKYVVHDKSTARLLFRPRSVRTNIDMVFPEEKSLEVSLSVADWTIATAYPMTSLLPDGPRQRLRWFLRVMPGGHVEDLLTGTVSNGLFVEMLPTPKARPETAPGPDDPLLPAWPDVRPQNAWCLPSGIFIPHIDRVLEVLGLPVESRTSMITSWLPSVTRHKNIAYKILSPGQLSPSSNLTIIPPPHVLFRIFILFRGVPDDEMKEWSNRGVVHAEMGLDWRNTIGWSEDLKNDELFRIIEYGAMEVFE